MASRLSSTLFCLQEAMSRPICTEFLVLSYKFSQLFKTSPQTLVGKGTLAGWVFTLYDPGVLTEVTIAIKGIEEFHVDKMTQDRRTLWRQGGEAAAHWSLKGHFQSPLASGCVSVTSLNAHLQPLNPPHPSCPGVCVWGRGGDTCGFERLRLSLSVLWGNAVSSMSGTTTTQHSEKNRDQGIP